MADTSKSIPFGSFGFKVAVSIGTDTGINGNGLFQEVSGLSAQINVTDLVEGGCNYKTHKLLGNTTYSNVTLKRGLCDFSMFKWIQDYMHRGKNSNPVRDNANVTIELLDDKGQTRVVYRLERVVPVKWDGPSLSVMQDGIATESIEFAHEGMTVEMK